MDISDGNGWSEMTNLSPRDEQIAQLLAGGAMIKSVAKAVGLSVSQTYRKAREPQIRARVAQIRRQYIDRTVGKLASLAGKATSTLAGLLRPGIADSVRLGAAKAVLDQLLEIHTYARLADRIDVLEKRLDEQIQRTP